MDPQWTLCNGSEQTDPLQALPTVFESWMGNRITPSNSSKSISCKIGKLLYPSRVAKTVSTEAHLESLLTDLVNWFNGFSKFLNDIDSDDKIRNSNLAEVFQAGTMKNQVFFEQVNICLEQGIEIHPKVDQYSGILQRFFLEQLEFKPPKHPHPFHHPTIARNLSEFFTRIGELLHVYSMNLGTSEYGEHQRGVVTTTIAFISLQDLERFAYSFHSSNYVNPMGGVDDETYARIKPWMQSKMLCAFRGADRAEENGYFSLYCDLMIHGFEIPLYFRTPYRVEDMCQVSYLNLETLIKEIERVNVSLLNETKWENNGQMRRQLLHRCRTVRGFFQMNFNQFKDETDWNSARMKAMFRATQYQETIDSFFLADLGESETIGVFGEPF
jgi:hypothetical protein